MTESDTRGQECGPNDRDQSIDTGLRSNSQSTDSIAAEDLLQALGNGRRRAVIRVLATGETDMDTLAVTIAAEENDTTVDEITSEQRKRAYIALHQVHLDALDDCGIVDRQRDGTIARGPHYRAARDALASITAIVDGQADQPLAADLREVTA